MRVREKRIPRKVPVRHFGLDATGHPFTDNAFTVDISSNGACLEGVWRAVRAGDVVGVQCGNMKARFKIAWVGQPNTPKHGRVGLITMERGKVIWTAAPPIEEPAPMAGQPAAAAAPALALVEPQHRKVEGMAPRLQALAHELNELNDKLRTESVNADSLRDFSAAVNQVRLTVWGLLRLEQQPAGRDDAFEAVTKERLRVATLLVHSVAMDIDAFEVTPSTAGIEQLRSAVKMLHARLIKLLGSSDA